MKLSSVLPTDVIDGVFELAPDPALILSRDTEAVLAMNARARAEFGHHARLAELIEDASPTRPGPTESTGPQPLRLRTVSGSVTFAAYWIRLAAEHSSFYLLTLRPPSAEESRGEAVAQRVELAGELAGGVARSFKNVLQAISLITEQAGEEGRSSTPGIDKAVTEALGLGGDLLDTWRALSEHDPELRPRRVDLAEIVRRCERLVRLLLGTVERVSFQCPPRAVEADGAEGQLIQIVLMLAIRARDAIARSRGSALDVGLSVAGDEVRLVVRDDGEALSPEDLDVLSGSGVGTASRPPGLLASLRRQAEAHGGRVTVTSPVVENRGTQVRITFPTASEPYPLAHERAPTTTETAQRRDSVWTRAHDVT